MSKQGGGLDFGLLLCNLAGHTVVPLPGKVPQNFCEPGRAGVVREIHPLRLCKALSVCLQRGAGMPHLVLSSLAACASQKTEVCRVCCTMRALTGNLGPERP